MPSTLQLLLHVLLVSLVSGSHFFGGTAGFTYKGRNADGTFRVESRYRSTFSGCQYSLQWQCGASSCSNITTSSSGVIDNSNNSQSSTRMWCERERVNTRILQSDKPFQTRVPQNCPRTYRLMAFDPDGDHVRCRYGNLTKGECSRCHQPQGFFLDQDSCTLYYNFTRYDSRAHAFETVVEDFPRHQITLTYSDGSRIIKSPLALKRKSRGLSWPQNTTPWWWRNTTTTPPPTTAWWWWRNTTTTPQPTTAWWWWGHTTTTPQPTTPWWWWGNTTSTPQPTTPWWWWGNTTTTPQPTTPWWWWWGNTTTTPQPTTPWWWWGNTTTTPQPTTPWWWWGNTTTTPQPTTPWWWWWGNTTTTPQPTTPWWWWGNTTTTPQPTTPWWWWGNTTTTPQPTTPWWWWGNTTTTPKPTTPWWWWGNTTTTPQPTTSWWWWTTPTSTPGTTTPWWWWTTTPTTPTTPWWWWTTTPTTPTTTRKTTTTTSPQHVPDPLTTLPLQFSFLVDPSAPSCLDGVYLPILVPPTPSNGDRIQAEVNEEVQIRVRAQATQSTIDDIIMTGPLTISKHMIARGEFVIRWTPTPNDLGEYYPVCFAVESKNGYRVYQSEMRCVLIEVVEEQVKTTVICSDTTMTVAVEKVKFPGIRLDRLQLNDPTNTACRLTSNSSHIFAVIPLNACGTQIEEDAENLLFKNEITTVDNPGDLITRKHLLEVQFYCQYRKRENITLGFMVHRDNVTVMEKGFGTFTYGFEFYPTHGFRAMIDPRSYPLEYDIGSRIFMQIEATSSLIDTELFVESCSAAPYDIPNYTPTYPIIENGCNVDSTVVTHPRNNSRQFRFSLEAFKFIGLHDQVYIHCSVLMCKAGENGTRCSQGCDNSTYRQSSGHYRGKREAISQTSRHFISQGPLRLRRSQVLSGNPVMSPNLNMNLVLIAGSLLAAVAMVSAVITYKAKISRRGYQPLATAES